MTKQLMISIQPKHAVNILNGKKTLELRTWIPKGYKGWVYVYVTKGVKDILYKYKDKYYTQHYLTFTDYVEVLNSKVVARFWFEKYEEYNYNNHGVSLYTDVVEYNIMYEDLDKLYLDYREIEVYGKGKTLYAWHIKKLEVFDTPKELSDYKVRKVLKQETYLYGELSYYEETLKKAPQKMTYVYCDDCGQRLDWSEK